MSRGQQAGRTRHAGLLDLRAALPRFYRVKHDKSGWEPRSLFNVVEFMMHDKDCSGTIDLDECMEILFRRFGKELLESKVNEFMGQDEDGDNDITYTEFLAIGNPGRGERPTETPSLMLSHGVVKQTLEENKKLFKRVTEQQTKAAAIKNRAR